MNCSLPGSAFHGDSPGKTIRVGCHGLLQGIFPTQESNPVSHIAGGFVTIWATRKAQEYWSGYPIPLPGKLPDSGIELGSPALQADSLPAKPPGKTENTRVGSPSLLQGIFPTQESNWGLLYCRRILYQLRYQRSPYLLYIAIKIIYYTSHVSGLSH